MLCPGVERTMALFLLSTASLYFDSLARSFRLARETGFDGLELAVTPASSLSRPARMAELARETGLQLASVHPPTIPLPGWSRSPDTFRRLAGLARALPGCRVVVLHTPAAGRQGEPRMERFRRTLAVLQEALAGSAVTVALENRNRRPGEPVELLDDPAALLAFAQGHGCGIVLDTAHASTLPGPLLETYRTVRPALANIHLSDVATAGWWDRFSYSRSILNHHRVPGQGVLPLPPLLAELGRSGYQGLITLELSPVALHCWSRPATRRILRQTLRDCRSWLASPQDAAG
jgi:sugar phosphate isomerase/epimerase